MTPAFVVAAAITLTLPAPPALFLAGRWLQQRKRRRDYELYRDIRDWEVWSAPMWEVAR